MSKTFFISVLFIAAMAGCAATEENPPAEKALKRNDLPKNQESFHFDQHRVIYRYDSTFTDSNLVCEQWFWHDTLIKKTGEFYYSLPLRSDFINSDIIDEAHGKRVYETFSPAICEAGGQSAYNKYQFIYDDQKRPVQVKHYKAWYEAYDKKGNFYTNKVPHYFLGETISFSYGHSRITQTAKGREGEHLETIVQQRDERSRLVFEQWDAWDTYRYRIFYKYQ